MAYLNGPNAGRYFGYLNAVSVNPNARRLSTVEVPEPRIEKPDDVLIQMIEVGLCGTDKEIAQFEYGTPPSGSEFLIIGHEGFGRVVQVGPEVKSLKPGDTVVPTVRRPCADPECVACMMGRQDFCYTGQFSERGIKELHGFMSERIVERELYLHLVPPDLRELGVLTEPLTISCKAARQIRDIQDRLPWGCAVKPQKPRREFACMRALVLGAGPVGLLGALTLAHTGFETVIYSNVGDTPERVKIAEACGCQFIPAEQTPVQELKSKVGRFDVVLEAVGASQLAFDVLNLLGNNAIFVFTGVPGRKTRITLNTDKIMRNMVLRNQVVMGTVNAAPEDFRSAIQALSEFQKKWPGVVERIKTGKFDPAQTPELLQKPVGIKNVICFER